MIYSSNTYIKSASVFDAILALNAITKNAEFSEESDYQEDLIEKIIELRSNGRSFLVYFYFPTPEEDFIKNSIKHTEILNMEYYLIHAELGLKKDFIIESIKKNIEWFYKEHSDYKITLENLHPNNKNEIRLGNIPEEILNFDSRTCLLLHFGHLKILSKLLEFNYLETVELIFTKYSHRILEIHISENYSKNNLKK